MMKRIPVVIAFVFALSLALGVVTAEALFRHDVTSVEDTAYAMGAASGGYGSIDVGDVAMHPKNSAACLDTDLNTACVPFLPFGTRLYMTNPSSVPIPQGNGSTANYTSFIVGDLGDLDYRYSSNAWWIDIYFGRWVNSGDACECWGVESSVCTIGSTNSCTNANNYGRHYDRAYYYYDNIPE